MIVANSHYFRTLVAIIFFYILFFNNFCLARFSLNTTTLWDGQQPEVFISSIVLNKQNYNQQIFLAEDILSKEIYVDLKDIVKVLNIQATYLDNYFKIETPIGSTKIHIEKIKNIDNRSMIALAYLADKLAISLSFDFQEYALIAEVPWFETTDMANNEIIEPSGNTRVVDISPTSVSLSYLDSEYYYRNSSTNETVFSQTEVGGNLLSGAWQARFRNYIDNDGFVENYLWYKNLSNQRWMVGNSPVSLNRILGGFNFTGVQTAWSNTNIERFTENIHSEQLIANQSSAIRTFKGIGIAGGTVELRIEGQQIATTITRLDGEFIFQNIQLPSTSYVQIEAWVYEPNIDSFPIKIINLSSYNNNRNLPDNMLLLQSGIGVNGNLIEQHRSDLDSAFFASAQYAINDKFTLESIVQSVGNEQTTMLGARNLLGRFGFLESNIAYNNGQTAWRTELLNQQKNWFIRGSAQHLPKSWLNRQTVRIDDTFTEFGWFKENLELSIIGRDFRSGNIDISYVLPAVRWRPSNRVSLSSRPDQNGYYSNYLTWQLSKKQHFNVLLNKNDRNALWQYRFNYNQRLSVQYIENKNKQKRTAFIYSHSRTHRRGFGWSAGILHGNNATGYLADLDYEITPGLRVRAQIVRDPWLSGANQPLDTVVGVNITANFNFGKQGISRGSFQRGLNNNGSITGVVKPPKQKDVSYNLGGISILVNGQLYTKTNSQGKFSIPYINNGIYEIELDLDGMPISLQPIKDSYVLRVNSGANTEVQFNTQVLLGISGTAISINGNVLANVALQISAISDPDNNILHSLITNTFGKFRFYGLKPDNYLLRLKHENQQFCLPINLTNNFITQLKVSNSNLCENQYEP